MFSSPNPLNKTASVTHLNLLLIPVLGPWSSSMSINTPKTLGHLRGHGIMAGHNIQDQANETHEMPTTRTQSAIGDEEKALDAPASAAQKDASIITWDSPGDPHNPQNFSFARKVFVTLIWVAGNLVTCIASSIFSSGASFISKEFDVGSTVTTLGISLFLLVRPPRGSKSQRC